jgi:hypothetical protein
MYFSRKRRESKLEDIFEMNYNENIVCHTFGDAFSHVKKECLDLSAYNKRILHPQYCKIN